MNAPAPAAALASAAFQEIDIKSVSVSPSKMQEHRRATFDKTAMQELVENVKSVGILQPILLRPIPKGFELVAGERRFLAAQSAKLAKVPAMIRTLSDVQALEFQVIENKHREDLHELIEAEGYEELMKKHGYTAEQVAQKIDMSRRHVFNRLKLLELCPEARTAFLKGQIQSSIAILIARVPVHDLQRQALKEVIHGRYLNRDDAMSVRQASDHLQSNYMLRLAQAPFKPGDETLIAKAGACGPCPKRTGNQPELFGDVKGADICTDPVCFAAKKAASMEQKRKDAVAKGQDVISGAEAKKLFPYSHHNEPQGYVSKESRCHEASGKQSGETYAKLLGKDAPPLVLVENAGAGTFFEGWPRNEVDKILRNMKIIKPRPKAKKPSRPGRPGSSGPSIDLDELVQQRIFMTAREKFDSLQQEELAALAFHEVWLGDVDEEVMQKLWGFTKWSHDSLQKRIMSMSIADLQRLLFDCAFLGAMTDSWGVSKALIAAVAKRVKLDPAKLKETIKAELKQQAELDKAAAKEAPAKKSAKKSV